MNGGAAGSGGAGANGSARPAARAGGVRFAAEAGQENAARRVGEDNIKVIKPDPKAKISVKRLVQASERPRKEFQLKDFALGRLLGKGRFGFVHVAKLADPALDQSKVALKILWKSDIVAEELTKQVQAECEIQAKFKHKNIVKLHTTFQDDARYFLVLEYVPGGSVLSLIESYDSHKVPEERAAQVMKDLSEAVAFCHQVGVIHRDIKPENVLLAEDGTAKLADFGWATQQDNHGAQAKSKRKTFCGTLDYLAPEMGEEGEGYDRKVDTWMVGCVCFEMVVGVAPFYNPDIASKRETDYRKKLAGNVSEGAQSLMDCLLQKEPEKRMEVKLVPYHPWVQEHWSEADRLHYTRKAEKRLTKLAGR